MKKIRKTAAAIGSMMVVMAILAPAADARFSGGGCPSGYHKDASGHCVHN